MGTQIPEVALELAVDPPEPTAKQPARLSGGISVAGGGLNGIASIRLYRPDGLQLVSVLPLTAFSLKAGENRPWASFLPAWRPPLAGSFLLRARVQIVNPAGLEPVEAEAAVAVQPAPPAEPAKEV